MNYELRFSVAFMILLVVFLIMLLFFNDKIFHCVRFLILDNAFLLFNEYLFSISLIIDALISFDKDVVFKK